MGNAKNKNLKTKRGKNKPKDPRKGVRRQKGNRKIEKAKKTAMRQRFNSTFSRVDGSW